MGWTEIMIAIKKGIVASAESVAKIISGATVVGKATADGNGNNIANTYQVRNGTSYLVSAFDANTFTDSGRYTHGNSANGKNIPNVGVFIVDNCGTYILQTVITHSGLAEYERISTDAGKTWGEWKEKNLTKYLPLAGGTLSSYLFSALDANGRASFAGASGKAYMEAWHTDNALRRQLVLHSKFSTADDAKCLGLTNTETGAVYTVLHTGNSVPVVVSATAPADTTAVWIVPS